MLSKKSIYETLAALGAGALMATGCGGSQQTPVNAEAEWLVGASMKGLLGSTPGRW